MSSVSNRFYNKINRFAFVEDSNQKRKDDSQISTIYNEKLTAQYEQPHPKSLDRAISNDVLESDQKRKRSPSFEKRKKVKIDRFFNCDVLEAAENKACLILKETSYLNSETLTRYLHTYSQKGDLELVFALLKEGKNRGVILDKFHYTTLLSCAVKQKNMSIELVQAIHETMIDSGISLDPITCKIIQKGYIQSIKDCLFKRDLTKAQALLEEMVPVAYKGGNFYQVQVGYGLVIDSHVEADELDKAVAIYHTMLSNRINPDDVIYSTLVKGYLREIRDCISEGCIKRARNQLIEISKFRGQVKDNLTIEKIDIAYNLVMDAYIAINKPRKVCKLFKERGSNPDFIECNKLIHFFLTNEVDDVARKLFKFIEKDYSFEVRNGIFDCHRKTAGTSYLAIEPYLNNLTKNELLTVITGQGWHSKLPMYDLQKKLIKIIEKRHLHLKITVDRNNTGQINIQINDQSGEIL